MMLPLPTNNPLSLALPCVLLRLCFYHTHAHLPAFPLRLKLALRIVIVLSPSYCYINHKPYFIWYVLRAVQKQQFRVVKTILLIQCSGVTRHVHIAVATGDGNHVIM